MESRETEAWLERPRMSSCTAGRVVTEEVLISWTIETPKFLTVACFKIEVQKYYPCCKAGLEDVKLKERKMCFKILKHATFNNRVAFSGL